MTGPSRSDDHLRPDRDARELVSVERLGAVRIGKPRRSPEWEWFYALAQPERLWLARWFMVDGGATPDDVAGWLGYGTDVDGAMAEWLAAARATRQAAPELDPSEVF